MQVAAGSLKFDGVDGATANAVKTARVELSSAKSIGVSNITGDSSEFLSATSSTLNTIESINIPSAEAAQSAINSIDTAIAQIERA
jgi:hypothetical protein